MHARTHRCKLDPPHQDLPVCPQAHRLCASPCDLLAYNNGRQTIRPAIVIDLPDNWLYNRGEITSSR